MRLPGRAPLVAFVVMAPITTLLCRDGAHHDIQTTASRVSDMPRHPHRHHARYHDAGVGPVAGAGPGAGAPSSSRARGMTWWPYSSMLVMSWSCVRPGMPYFRSNRVAPRTRRFVAIL